MLIEFFFYAQKLINLSKSIDSFSIFLSSIKLFIHAETIKSQTMASECINDVIKFNELYNKGN